MTAEKIKNRISENLTHFCFEYQSRMCGVDPVYSPEEGQRYNMWFGDEQYTAKIVDEVMTVKMFDGKCLNEIYNEIEIIAW